MVKGKVAQTIVKKARPYAEKAKLGAGAAIAEKATDIVDNPIVSAAEGALVGYAVGGPVGAVAGERVSEAFIRLHLQDTNDNSPQFSQRLV